MSKPFYNIIFCIFGCDTIERYRQEILKVKETWGKVAEQPTDKAAKPPSSEQPTDKAAKPPSAEQPTDKAAKPPSSEQPTSYKLLFFLGEEGPFDTDDCVHLENVENDYLSASYKQYGGLKYIYENYNFNYVFICGTDTYVLTDNLIEFINQEPQINPDKPLVIGGHGDNRQICGLSVHFFAGGAGIILTKAAMNIIYPELKTMQEEWMWLCVENGYNTYIPACDLSLCYFLKRSGITFLNVVNRFFDCNYLGYYHNSSACCAKTVDHATMISCHNMSLGNFDKLYDIKKQFN